MIRVRELLAVGYVRMSSDQQEDSPARQRAEITRLAKQERCKIIEWYQDHGLTGTESANRPDFQRLLRDAQERKFDAILVHEQSRFSREDVFDVMLHWRLLRMAGVVIISTGRGRIDLDSLGGLITAIVEQHGAHEESIKIADRSVSGKRLALEQGRWLRGHVFGYDRIIRRANGQEMLRVHFSDRFRKPKECTVQPVISSDLKAVRAIRAGFQMIAQGDSLIKVARHWNGQGLTSTKGNAWRGETVRQVLGNALYAGMRIDGAHGNGKFRRIATSGPIVQEDRELAIVGKRLFYRVQAVLDRNSGLMAKRAPGRYLLAGLVRCAHCGVPICGRKMYGIRYYAGARNVHSCKSGFDEPSRYVGHAIFAEPLEEFVLKQVQTRILTEAHLKAIGAVLSREKQEADADTSEERAKLSHLEARIARAGENLALAQDPEDFRTVSELLTKWRNEAADLRKRIQRKGIGSLPNGQAVKVLKNLVGLRDRLREADRAKLAQALRHTIEVVEIGKRKVGQGEGSFVERYGLLKFKPGWGQDEPIPITDNDLAGRRRRWRDVAAYIGQQGRPVRRPELAEHFQRAPTTIDYYLRKAESAGLVSKATPGRGWVAPAAP